MEDLMANKRSNGTKGSNGSNGQNGKVVTYDVRADGAVAQLELDDVYATRLLEAMHRLLLAHKFDHARQDAIARLVATLPDLEAHYEGLTAGDGGVTPAAVGALDDLLAGEDQHAREAMLVGYLLGSLQTRITTYHPADRVALQVVYSLGLQEAMELNVGYGLRLAAT
jgi:hypothetical protein